MDGKQHAEFVTTCAPEERFQLFRIEIEGLRIDINKHRQRACPHNRAGRREKTEWRGEDLISRLHSSGDKSQPQCVSARRAAYCFTRATEVCHLVLKRFHLCAKNVMLRCANFLN